jgi:hypothetical protein
MVRVNLPPGCAGIGDGDWKKVAKPGTHINLDDTDPFERKQLKKLQGQDYAAAGLVDAGPEKFAVGKVHKGPEGRWCPECPNNTIWHSWTKQCPSCGADTVPESDMVVVKREGYYMP